MYMHSIKRQWHSLRDGWIGEYKQLNNNKYKEALPQGQKELTKVEKVQRKKKRCYIWHCGHTMDGWVTHLSRWESTFSNSRWLFWQFIPQKQKKVYLFTPESRFQTVFSMKTDHLALKNIPCLKKKCSAVHFHPQGQRKSDGALYH